MSDNENKQLPTPKSYDDLFPGRFLKAGSFLGRDVTLTIAKIEVELMPKEKGNGEEPKAIIYFRENNKLGAPCQTRLNRTNGECLKAMFGKNVLQDWPGKRVTLFPTTDKMGGKTVDAIRVRGSPDIERDIEFLLELPKRKPKMVKLVKTSKSAAKQPVLDTQPAQQPSAPSIEAAVEQAATTAPATTPTPAPTRQQPAPAKPPATKPPPAAPAAELDNLPF